MSRFKPRKEVLKLEEVLALMTCQELRRLAGLTHEKLPTRKGDLVAVIRRHLSGKGLRAVWEDLDELQRAAVAEVVHSASLEFPADRFSAKYGRGPDWGTAGTYSLGHSPSALCFFFYGDGVMPGDLKKRLEAFVPQPEKAQIKTLAELPAAYDRPYSRWNAKKKTLERGTEAVPFTVRESERAAQRELLSVLRLVDAGKISVSSKTRRPSAATIEAIAGVLEGGDYYPRLPVKSKWHDENAGPIRAFVWPLLVQAGGLAQLSGSKLKLTRAGRRALSEPAPETIATLWSKWIDSKILDELSRIECVKGQRGRGKRGLTAVSSRREVIADTLAECPAGAWIAADEFIRFLRASDEGFAVTRNAWHLYIGELQYGSLGYENAERILEQRYLFAFLLEYAATLGLLDVALVPPAGARHDYGSLWGADDLPYLSRYDGLFYVRITPLGTYCLGGDATYEPAPVEVRPVLRILPNLEVAAVGAELEQGDRLALDAYATRVSDHLWRLDPGRLLAAIEAGRPVEEIREFLSARSSSPIPGTVSRLLDDVAERSVKVCDRGLARLVECADPALAALIANDPRTRKHCLCAGERHLVVPASAETAFRRALREVGYLLAADEAKVKVKAKAELKPKPKAEKPRGRGARGAGSHTSPGA